MLGFECEDLLQWWDLFVELKPTNQSKDQLFEGQTRKPRKLRVGGSDEKGDQRKEGNLL